MLGPEDVSVCCGECQFAGLHFTFCYLFPKPSFELTRGDSKPTNVGFSYVVEFHQVNKNVPTPCQCRAVHRVADIW